MINDYLKIAAVTAIGLLVGYVYYSVVIVPEQTIQTLNVELIEQKKIPAKVVSKINAVDANRTQKEINNVDKSKVIIIDDHGIILF